MSKQDRQGARTPAALERKYDFGQRFNRQEQTNKDQNAETAALAARMENHIQDSNASLARIAQDLTKAGAALSLLEENFFSLNADMDKNFDSVSQTVSGLARVVSALTETVSGLSSAVAAQGEKIAGMETKIASFDTKFVEMDVTLTDIKTRLEALEA